MTYLYGRSSAAAMISAALSMRLFLGMTVYFPYAANAAWMCPLVGFVFYLPLAVAVNQSGRIGNSSAWNNLSDGLTKPVTKFLDTVFALLLMYDVAVHIRLMASSSNIIALGDVTVHLLIVPLGIVAGIVILLGGDALGNSARIALRVLPVFVVIMLLVQAKSYTFGWIAPYFGSGINAILAGSLYCAGCMALLTFPWMIALPDRYNKGIFLSTAIPTIGVSILLVLLHMSFPMMPDTMLTQAARIELLLSNGRMSLSPQFLLNLLWFGGILYLFSAEIVAAAGYILHALPNLHLWIIALTLGIAVSAFAIFNPGWLQQAIVITGYTFPFLGIVIAGMLTIAIFKNRGNKACKNQE